MKPIEDNNDFYNSVTLSTADKSLPKSKQGNFNVYFREASSVDPVHRRRDFYKIAFVKGISKVHFADKWIAVDQPVLIFSNPRVAYSWEAGSTTQSAFCSLFTESFLEAGDRAGTLKDSPLFSVSDIPVYFPNEAQQAEIVFIFQKMLREMESDYEHKYQVLRNCLHLLVYEAMKMSPTKNFHKQISASSRITNLFFDLLERQFAVNYQELLLQMHSPQDYAGSLSISVNHLNRAIKEATGKTTSDHISARIIQEANLLLQHSDQSISEIAYSLGFEYPAYFAKFFKKHTGRSPMELRHHVA